MHEKSVPARILEFVVEQNLDDSGEIGRQFLADESFRAACEDYALVCEKLVDFEAVTDGSRDAEIAEYRSMKAELVDELKTIMTQSRKRGFK